MVPVGGLVLGDGDVVVAVEDAGYTREVEEFAGERGAGGEARRGDVHGAGFHDGFAGRDEF